MRYVFGICPLMNQSVIRYWLYVQHLFFFHYDINISKLYYSHHALLASAWAQCNGTISFATNKYSSYHTWHKTRYKYSDVAYFLFSYTGGGGKR